MVKSGDKSPLFTVFLWALDLSSAKLHSARPSRLPGTVNRAVILWALNLSPVELNSPD